jgi:hypothetical protein
VDYLSLAGLGLAAPGQPPLGMRAAGCVRIGGVPLPETHLRQIARWCERRIPAHARGEVRVEHTVRGSNVTILEVRPPWREDFGPEWTRRPIAQLRHDGTRWWLYWPDRNTRWHLLQDIPAQTAPAPLLDVIDEPGRPFW